MRVKSMKKCIVFCGRRVKRGRRVGDERRWEGTGVQIFLSRNRRSIKNLILNDVRASDTNGNHQKENCKD